MKTDTLVTGLLMATALRASEGYRPPDQRLFNPAFDRQFLPPLARLLIAPGFRQILVGLMTRVNIGAAGMLLCRTRYIDDALNGALADGIRQVVNLGAGLDTRVFRIPGIEQARTFELDQPGIISWKQERLKTVLGDLPSHLTLIPIDFETQSLADVLAQAGFQPGVPTFFIWEGVTQYISADAVDGTLRFVREGAGPDSQIVFTFIRQGVVDGSARSGVDAYIMGRAARGGLPWGFGIEPDHLKDFLRERGLNLLDVCDADGYRARFLEPLQRSTTIYDGELMALAQVGDHKSV